MSSWFGALIRASGILPDVSLERACRNPRAAQESMLMACVSRNADTDFGRKHVFTSIRNAREYRERVPIRDYEGFRPFVERAVRGETGVLTRETPILFLQTSGTTAEPKLIPVTPTADARDSRFKGLWVSRALRDHPGFLDQGIFAVVSPAGEGRTSAGIPIGNASGWTVRRLPIWLRRSLAAPRATARIADYSMRYRVMMRLAMERRVSHTSTANPSTLIKAAETGMEHAGEIIRAIRDGKLFPGIPEAAQDSEGWLLRDLESRLRPNPRRAAELEKLAARGRLLPMDYWPDLKLLSCWTGGSVGPAVARLREFYGSVPIRDLGYLASEGRFTLPFRDGTAAGIPALRNYFFEFLPEDQEDSQEAKSLLLHELEPGKCYAMVITTWGGLYRYSMHDIVRVEGFHGQVPLLAFLRKGRDMASITGEKLHVNHVLAAMASTAGGAWIRQYQVAADPEQGRYRVYMEPEKPATEQRYRAWLGSLDRELRACNMEYE